MFVEVLEADFSQVARVAQAAAPAGAPLRMDELFIDALPDGRFAPQLATWPQDGRDAGWVRTLPAAEIAGPGYAGFDAFAVLPPIEAIAGIAGIAPI